MSDEAGLWVVLVALYLSECVWFVRRQAVAFLEGPGGRWRLRLPGRYLGNPRGGLMLLNPLPPLGASALAQPWPFSFSPQGVTAFVSQAVTALGRPPQPETTVRFEDFRKASAVSNELIVNGERLATCSSEPLAESFAETLRAWAALPEAKRADAMRQAMCDALDDQAVGRMHAEFLHRARGLRLFANALWIFYLVVCPAVVIRFGLLRFAVPMGVAILALHGIGLVLFYRTHRAVRGEARGERVMNLVKMALCPPMVIRAADAVSKHLLERFHPLAVAAARSREVEFLAYAQTLYRDNLHPVPAELSAPAQAIDAWFRAAWREALDGWLARRGIDAATWLAPPEAAGGSYCPRCHTPYEIREGICADCYGVALQARPAGKGN